MGAQQAIELRPALFGKEDARPLELDPPRVPGMVSASHFDQRTSK